MEKKDTPGKKGQEKKKPDIKVSSDKQTSSENKEKRISKEQKADVKTEEGKSERVKKADKYKAEYHALHDKYLRLSAEFDNYRKRTLKEKADLTKFAGEGLLAGLLPVIDDFERAIGSMPEGQSCEAVREGTVLIYNKFKEFLRQNGVEGMEAIHNDFDTDLHEAVTKIPAPEKKLKGKVVDVILKGYYLNGKVLRFAKVVIGE
jgi:molecular chaperone GrpE